MSDVTVEMRAEGRVALVRLDRGTKANALSFEAMRRLTETALRLGEAPALSAVVLAGGENFSLGFDLKDGETAGLSALPLAERRRRLQTGRKMCRAWAELECLTIAAVRGWCVGGGVALAGALDLRVAEPGAVFYAPEIERGMNMSWGSVPRLVALLGPARAKRLLILAERWAAAEAERFGLVDEVAADAEAAALALALRAASMPPVPLRMIKRAVEVAALPLAEAASAADFDQFALAQTGADHAEGVSAFIEGRPPRFTGA